MLLELMETTYINVPHMQTHFPRLNKYNSCYVTQYAIMLGVLPCYRTITNNNITILDFYCSNKFHNSFLFNFIEQYEGRAVTAYLQRIILNYT